MFTLNMNAQITRICVSWPRSQRTVLGRENQFGAASKSVLFSDVAASTLMTVECHSSAVDALFLWVSV